MGSLNKTEFTWKMHQCRNYYKKIDEITRGLFNSIDKELNMDLEMVPFDATNADNLSDAILCYMQYGEDDPLRIWKKIEELREDTEHEGN